MTALPISWTVGRDKYQENNIMDNNIKDNNT